MPKTTRELIEEFLRELEEPINDETVAQFEANQGRTAIAMAAAGDIHAIIAIRQQCGLPPIMG